VLAGEAEDAWPMFRGNPLLTGVARCDLPEEPKLLWKFNAGDVIASSAAICDGVVYFGCDNGTLHAVRLADGSLKWRSRTAASTQPAAASQSYRPAIQSSPCVYRGSVYFGDEEGVFHALEAASGRPRWTFETGGEIISSANCADERVLFGSYDGHLYCLSTRDGALLWKLQTEGRVHGTPAIAGEFAIAAGCDEKLHVARLADGERVRAVSLGGYSGASAAILGRWAFAGTFSNQVVGVDWQSGARTWLFEDPDRQFPFYASAAVTEHCVVIGGRDKLVRGLEPQTGRPLWRFQTRGRVDASPVIVGRRVFAASLDANLYALDLATGRETWRFEVGSPLHASPAVAQGRLVIGSEDGTLYCFGAKGSSR